MGTLEDLIAGLEGFEWDAGNTDKNWLRHAVRQAEAEQALSNSPLVVAQSLTEASEPRLIALGHTDAGRQLTIVFTVCGTRIRVISARAMSKAERKAYAQADQEADS